MVVRDFVKDCLVRLSGVCDGAIDEDGAGFSKATQSAGHFLAGLGAGDYTDEMLGVGAAIVACHASQLGLSEAQLDTVNKRGTRITSSIVRNVLSVSGDKLFLHFYHKPNKFQRCVLLSLGSECVQKDVGYGYGFLVPLGYYSSFDAFFEFSAWRMADDVHDKAGGVEQLEYEGVDFTCNWIGFFCGSFRLVFERLDCEDRKFIEFLGEHASLYEVCGCWGAEVDSVCRKYISEYFDPINANWHLSASAKKHLNDTKAKTIDLGKFEDRGKRIVISDDGIDVFFPYDAKLVTAVKEFSDRKFTRDGEPHWRVVITTKDDLDHLNKFTDSMGFVLEGDESLLPDSQELESASGALLEWSPDKPDVAYASFRDIGRFLDEFKDVIPQSNRKWDKTKYRWELACNAALCGPIKRLSEIDGWDVGLDLIEYLEYAGELEQQKAEMATSLTSDDVDIPALNGTLMPFQNVAVRYADMQSGLLIADEMGLGKTIEALAIVARKGFEDNFIVVCPAIARLTWEYEINKWLPDVSVAVALDSKSSTVRNIKNANVAIVSYNLMTKFKQALIERGSGAIIMDESHYIKNAKSQRSKATLSVAKNIQCRLALTGTPLLNRPIEIANQLDAIGHLDATFGGFWSFAKRYCNAHKEGWGWNFDGASNSDELNKKLLSSCMVRRKKEDVLTDLPPKRRAVVSVGLSNTPEYNQVIKDIRENVREDARKSLIEEALRQGLKDKDLTVFVESNIDKKIEALDSSEMLRLINKLRQCAAKGKVSDTIDWVLDFCDSGEKLVVFAHHKDVQEKIFKGLSGAGLNVGHIFSTDSAENRQRAIESFQKGDMQVIVCSLQAASTNITLTASTNVFFHELDWKPGTLLQAEGRCLRIGTSTEVSSVNMWYALAKNTIDSELYRMIADKFEVISEVTDGKKERLFDENESSANMLRQLFIEVMGGKS